MANATVYFDIEQTRFVYPTTGVPLANKDYPVIVFKEYKQITWNIGYWDSATSTFINLDLSTLAVSSWQSSVDYDFSTSTDPMIRMLDADIDDSDAADGIIVVTYDADTEAFETAVDGQTNGRRLVQIQLKGSNAGGKLVCDYTPMDSQFFARMQVDPGSDPVGATTSNFYTKSEVDAKLYYDKSVDFTINNGVTSNIVLFDKTVVTSGNIDITFSDTVHRNKIIANIVLDIDDSIIPDVTWIYDNAEQINITYTLDISSNNVRLNITNSSGNTLTGSYQLFDYTDTRLAQQNLSWKGAWSGATTYGIGECVSSVGCSYISLDNGNLNHEPPNITYWGILALSGSVSGQIEGSSVLSTGEAGGTKFLREDGDGTCSWQTVSVSTDEKVKYDAADPTAGYVADKIVAGTGISVAEGNGATENKLVVTSTITQYTDELAQDAVGGMVNSTLTYTDGTPELKVTNPVTPQTTGFTISAGTTPKTLTVADTASVTGTNTGDNAPNTSIVATKLDDFATPDNNTDLNANTTNHGLLLQATAPAAGLTNVVAIENGETVYKNKALFDATVPSTQALGDSAAVGSAVVAARRDHKHAMPAAAITNIGNGSAQYQVPVTGTTPFAPVYTTATGTGSPVLATAPTFVTNITTPIIKPAADSTTAVKITKADGSTSVVTIDTTNSRLGIGATPTAKLNIAAGTATASTAPIKLTQASAVVLTTPEPGAIECNDGDLLYYTIKTASARRTIAFLEDMPTTLCRQLFSTGDTSVTTTTIPNNAQQNFGITNFTMSFKIAFKNWTPGGTQYLFFRRSGSAGAYYGSIVSMDTNNKIVLYLYRNSAAAAHTSTIATGFPADSMHEITIVVVREQLGIAGSVTFYVNGIQFGNAIPITAASTITLDNTGTGYLTGDGSSRTESTLESIAFFNRALSAADVYAKYYNGVHYYDKWGSQTAQTSGTLVKSKRYRINTYVEGDNFTNIGGTNASGSEFVATGTTPTTWANGSSIVPIGALLALIPENIAYNQWYDASSNAIHAAYPTSGTSITRINSVVNVTPQTELTNELTTLTYTAPGTPDYALQDLVQNTGFGFANKDEGNTVMSVIVNLQTRVKELEDKLVALGLLSDAD